MKPKRWCCLVCGAYEVAERRREAVRKLKPRCASHRPAVVLDAPGSRQQPLLYNWLMDGEP